MAKELPYFKFNVAEFLLGRISTETDAIIGAFTLAGAYYWHKECSMSRLEFEKKMGKGRISKLIDLGYLIETGLNITIPFLDEQWIELSESHVVYSKNGSIGAKKRWAKNDSKANGQANSEANGQTIALRKEEDKDKDKIRKEQEAYVVGWLRDLENSIALETIAMKNSVSLETVKSFIPDFRVKAELTYPTYDRFISHFKNFITSKLNEPATKKGNSDRFTRQESVESMENLALTVLGANPSSDG